MPYTLIAPCFFGTESTLAFEVRRLGAQNVQVSDGRVQFEGDAGLIAAANLNLRTAERVLLLLGRWQASTFDELFDGAYAIPWEEILPADAAFPVKGSSLSSQLSSVPACQSVVKKAVVKRLMAGHKVSALPETGPLYKLRIALRKNTAEMLLDTSGDGLHKRGYRKNATLAPIKETLAAGIVDLGRVRRDSLSRTRSAVRAPLSSKPRRRRSTLRPACAAGLRANISAFCPPKPGGKPASRRLKRPSRTPPLKPKALILTPQPSRWPPRTPNWPGWGTAAGLLWPMCGTSARTPKPSC